MEKIIFTIVIVFQTLACKAYSQVDDRYLYYDYGWRFQVSLGSMLANEIDYILNNSDESRGVAEFKEVYLPSLGLGFSYRSENGLELGLELSSFDHELEHTLLTEYADAVYLAGERHVLLLTTGLTYNFVNNSHATPYVSVDAGISRISPDIRLEVSDNETFRFENDKPSHTRSGSAGIGVNWKIKAVNLGLFYDYLILGSHKTKREPELPDEIMQSSGLPSEIKFDGSTNHRTVFRVSFPLYD